MRRRLMIILAFVVLGAVVNVAVAWCLCAREPPPFGPWQEIDRSDPEVRALVDRAWPFEMQPWSIAHSERIGLDAERLTAGSGLVRLSREERIGWPVRSLRGYEASMLGGASRTTEGVLIINMPLLGETRLLVHPIWSGLAIDTAFYGVLLWLLVGGVFALRRRIRIRSGRCARCGYPGGQSEICAECGATL